MKKKIGFIDLHIDEWHANNYPSWFAAAERAAEFELGYAWEESPNPDGLPLAAWCAKNGMLPAASIEEVVDKSDCICVLAPSNPEAHERLSEVALKAGKPLYIDKTFAPDKRTAIKFFDTARANGTPLMSSSALRYGEEFVKTMAERFSANRPLHVTTTGGGSSFQEYSIHQIEMIVAALGTGAESVTRLGGCETEIFHVAYADGIRSAFISYNPNTSFSITAISPDGAAHVLDATNMFPHLLDNILGFYSTGISPIPEAETIEVAAIREAAIKAEGNPGSTIRIM